MDRIPIISTPKFAVWLILFLSILVYSHTLVCQFVYDDLVITVMENPALLGTANVWEILTWDRPLREFTYMADHALWGFHPFGYHLQNIIWHAANGVLLYFLLMYLGVKKEGSLAIALLFAVHPINTEAVAWVSGRKELLCLFFELTACFLFVSALNKEKIHIPNYFLSILALILALLSKQVAVATPFLCLACWVFFLAKKGRAIHIKKALLGVAPLFIITIFFIFFRYDVIHRLDVIHSKGTFYDPSARDVSFTFLSAILTPFATFAKSIWLFIYPIDLTIERGFEPVTTLFDIRWVIGFLLIIGLLYLAISTFKRVPAIALGLFWLMITWAPISGFAPVAYLLADRYLYIPCIGFCIAGISWAAYLLARYPQRYKIGLLALICLFFTVRTVDRTFD
ncbi:hypothetical protein GF373_10690, partial [bacterium]|nr:hypothetical protein [bacterium]